MTSPNDGELFDTSEFALTEDEQGHAWRGDLGGSVATERKSLLIEDYLRLFVIITKGGNYIDAFAGPQNEKRLDHWAARRVWKANPGRKRRRIKRFELFELNSGSVAALENMVEETDSDGREIRIHPTDCNQGISKLLEKGDLKGPTFCLLDQRTTECRWSTVQALAGYGPGKHKIELFYFLMAGWKDRSLKNLKDSSEIRTW